MVKCSVKQVIGVLGGTFNPVHIGHLETATQLKRQLGFAEMRLLPCHIPAHRERPSVDASHRLNMLKLAVVEFPELSIDNREISRDQTSFTIDSLVELRNENPDSSICFCMGIDAFNQLHTWHRHAELLNYCHLVVTQRPSIHTNKSELSINTEVAQLYQSIYVDDSATLLNQKSGVIYFCSPTEIPISSTQLRQSLNQNISFIPPSVAQYALKNHLYTL